MTNPPATKSDRQVALAGCRRLCIERKTGSYANFALKTGASQLNPALADLIAIVYAIVVYLCAYWR